MGKFGAQKKPGAANQDAHGTLVSDPQLTSWWLPAEMCESFVGVGHAVDIFASGHGGPFSLEGGRQFVGKFLSGRTAFLIVDGHENPSEGKRLLSNAIHLHRHLIGRSADTLGTNFDAGLDVLDSLVEDLDWFFFGDAFFDDIQGVVQQLLSHTLFAILHEAIDKLAGKQRPKTRVRLELFATSGNSCHGF